MAGRIGISGLAHHHYIYHSLPRMMAQRGHRVLVSGSFCPPFRHANIEYMPQQLTGRNQLSGILVFPGMTSRAPVLPRVPMRVVVPHEDTIADLLQWCHQTEEEKLGQELLAARKDLEAALGELSVARQDLSTARRRYSLVRQIVG